jgi:hypothetical protein
LFARVKGKAENALKKLPFKRLYIFRPGGIMPVNLPNNLAFKKKLKFGFVKFLFPVFPRIGISMVHLAQAMLILVKDRKPSVLLENKDIKKIVINASV